MSLNGQLLKTTAEITVWKDEYCRTHDARRFLPRHSLVMILESHSYRATIAWYSYPMTRILTKNGLEFCDECNLNVCAILL